MADSLLTGSICLTEIPRELIRSVTCKDGKVRKYLNISILAKRTPQTFTNNGVPRTYTHYVSCAPRKDEHKEGVNYILGDLETKVFGPIQPAAPTQQAGVVSSPQSGDPF